MRLTRTSATELTITGNIKTTAHYLAIRKLVTELVDAGASALTLRINESLSMPSSVIGFFVKLVNRDKIRVSMLLEDPRLLELLDELGIPPTTAGSEPMRVVAEPPSGAVVIEQASGHKIQAAPVRELRTRDEAKSSARPTSPVTRARAAMSREDSMCQIASIARCASGADTGED